MRALLMLLLSASAAMAATPLQNMLDLPAASVVAGQSVSLSGRDAVADGGGGIFTIVADTGQSTNRGTIFRFVNRPNMLAVRQVTTPMNVRWFGASGNGVTDDTTPIQAAFDTLPLSKTPLVQGAPSGKVYLPAGNYKITAPISVPCGSVVYGDGRDSTTISNATTTATSIQILVQANANSQTLVVRDLCIAGSQNATAGAAIDATQRGAPLAVNAPWPMLENLTLFGHYYGIMLSNTVMGSIKNVRIHNPRSHGVYSRGFMTGVDLSSVWVIEAGGDGMSVESAYFSKFSAFDAQSCLGWGVNFGSTLPYMNSCDLQGSAEANALGGFKFTEPANSRIQVYTYGNTNYGCRFEGANGCLFMPTLQNDHDGVSLSLAAGPTYGFPHGLTMMGDMIAHGTGATNIDFPERIGFWFERDSATGVSRFILGGKTTIDTSTGSIVTGRTNGFGFPSYVARHDQARLRLETATDPVGYWTELINNYNVNASLQLFAAASVGDTIGIEIMRWIPQGQTYLSFFPRTPAGGLNPGIGIGYTNTGINFPGLAIRGGVGIGTTVDPGFGGLTLVGTLSLANLGIIQGTNFAQASTVEMIKVDAFDRVSIAGGGAKTLINGDLQVNGAVTAQSVIRLPNNTALYASNAVASANIPLIMADTADQVRIAPLGTKTIIAGNADVLGNLQVTNLTVMTNITFGGVTRSTWPGAGSSDWTNELNTLHPIAQPTNFVVGPLTLSGGTITNSYHLFARGGEAGNNLSGTNVHDLYLDGWRTGFGANLVNVYDVNWRAYFAGANSAHTNSADLNFDGTYAGVSSTSSNSSNLFFKGHSSGQGSVSINSGNLFFDGNEAGLGSTNIDSGNIVYSGNETGQYTTLTNSWDVTAINGALQSATLIDSTNVVAIGRGAGNSVSGTYTNVVFLGAGAAAGATASDQVILGTSMNLVLAGTTNHVVFGSTNTPPVSSAAPTKWISVQVQGDAGVYRLPLYE